jgi:hypothetical protein
MHNTKQLGGVAGKRAVSILSKDGLANGGTTNLTNVGKYYEDYMASCYRRL